MRLVAHNLPNDGHAARSYVAKHGESMGFWHLKSKKKKLDITVPIDRILSVKNASAWVSMDFT